PGATITQSPARIDAMGLLASNAPTVQAAPAPLGPSSANMAATTVVTPSSSSFMAALDGGYAGDALPNQDGATDRASSEEEGVAAHVLSAPAFAASFLPEATLADESTPRFDFGDAALLEGCGEEDADAPSQGPAVNLPLPSAALLLGVAFALAWRDRRSA